MYHVYINKFYTKEKNKYKIIYMIKIYDNFSQKKIYNNYFICFNKILE